MKSYRLSREALLDADKIFYSVAQRSSVEIADSLIEAITDRFRSYTAARGTPFTGITKSPFNVIF